MARLAKAGRARWRLRGLPVMFPALVIVWGGLPGASGVAAAEPAGRRVDVASGQAGGRDLADDGERSFWMSLSTESRYGPIRGFVQTPAGGRIGTTSRRRPTFDQLGIEEAVTTELQAKVGLGRHGLFAAVQNTGMSERTMLDRALVSQARTYPAGTPVRSEIGLSVYRVGYQYRFALRNAARRFLEITPSAELAYLDVDYRLRGGGVSSRRSYLNETPRVGVEAEWFVTDRISILAGGWGSIPIPETPDIRTLKLTAKYRFWQGKHFGAAVFAGVAYEFIEYEDGQTIPNHVRAEIGPAATLGVRISF